MKKSFLHAAVIGLGIGERHITGYESTSRCKVSAICDIDPQKLKEVHSRYPHCQTTTNAADILMDPSIDVVSIASYDNDHAQYVVEAINSGKHVYVEKPICLYDVEFNKINQALSENPAVKLSSNLVLRKHPQFLKIKEKIENGEMGKMYHFEGDYNYGRLHKLTEGWRSKIPFYSVIHGGAIHMIDLILWLSGDIITEVVSMGNNISSEETAFRFEDVATIMMRFESGLTAKVTTNFGSVCPHHYMLSAYGTKASFIHDYRGGAIYHSRNPDDGFKEINMKFVTDNKYDVQRSFVAAILDGTKELVTIPDVMNTMAVSLAAQRSLVSRQWEKVEYASIPENVFHI